MELKGQIKFVTSGSVKSIHKKFANTNDVTKAEMPQLVIVDPTHHLNHSPMVKYVWEGDIKTLTADDIKNFVGEFQAGNLHVHLKS